MGKTIYGTDIAAVIYSAIMSKSTHRAHGIAVE